MNTSNTRGSSPASIPRARVLHDHDRLLRHPVRPHPAATWPPRGVNVPALARRFPATCATLAQQVYDSRDFGAMPILADSLQDAGCEDEDALSHCRREGPHVRGGRIVSLVLGKHYPPD